MAGPLALIGFGFLTSVFSSLFTVALEALTKYFTKKVAVRILGVGTVVFLFGAMVAVIEGAIASLSFVLPAEFNQMIGYILPWNTSTCISAVITAKIARHVYDSNTKWVQWSLPGM